MPVISKMLTGDDLQPEAFCRSITDMFRGISIVIITAADKGCFVFDKKFIYVPGVPVEVTDAVGAGDAFSAAFMHSYFPGGDVLQAARIANEVGAYVATRSGAVPSYSQAIKNILRSAGNMRTEAFQVVRERGSIL